MAIKNHCQINVKIVVLMIWYHVGLNRKKISDEIKNIFPNSIIENLSSDTFSNLENFNSIIKNIVDGKVNFIIGTQILAKDMIFQN